MHRDSEDSGLFGFETFDLPGLAQRFRLFGNVLFLIYIVVLLGAILPLRLLDPGWQVNCVNQLIWNAHLPLIGLGLVHLAVSFDPLSPSLVRHRDQVARAALPVALGFLLTVPLLGFASLQGRSAMAPMAAGHTKALRQLEAIRFAVDSARSADEMEQRLARLGAPALLAADAALPLPRLKTKLQADLATARRAISLHMASPPPPSLGSLVQQHLRTVVMALAFAFAFLSGAQGPRSLRSPLEEWVVAWQHSRKLAAERRRIRRDFRDRMDRLRAEQNLVLRTADWQDRSAGLPDRAYNGFDHNYIEQVLHAESEQRESA